MKKLLLFVLSFVLSFSIVSSSTASFSNNAVLENNYQVEYQYGPYLGDVVANPGQQSWVRKEDKKYKNGNSGPQTEKIGTIENGDRLPCVGLMVNSGWYRVVARGQIAYVSYMYTWLDTSMHRKPQVQNPLNIITVQASSERPRSRWTDGAGNYYYFYAQNMIDGNLTTAWTPGSGNKLINDGIGEYATFYFQTSVTLDSVQLLNGYQRSKEAFYENSRPRQIEVSFQKQGSSNFVKPLAFTLYDNLVGWQHLNFEPQDNVTAFRLKILDVYSGSKFDYDIGISEVQASGLSN